MKLKATFGVCLLVLAEGASAEADIDWPEDTQHSMTWPLYPKESLNDLARQFYPNNQHMQQQFVLKALRLNRATYTDLKAEDRFNVLTPMQIPTLKSLSATATNSIRTGKPHKKSGLHMTTDLPVLREKVTQSLVKTYESLVVRNEFLKKELKKLNERIDYLKIKVSDLQLKLDRVLHDFPNLPASATQAQSSTMPPPSAAPAPVVEVAKPISPAVPEVTAPAPASPSAPVSSNQASSTNPNNTQTQNGAITLPQAKVTNAPISIELPPNPTTHGGAKLKNLDKVPHAPVAVDAQEMDDDVWWRNPLLWASVLLGFLSLVVSVALRKYRQRLHQDIFKITQDKTPAEAAGFSQTWQDTQLLESNSPLDADSVMIVQEIDSDNEMYVNASLEKAKRLIATGNSDEAITHLKEMIKESPKASIHPWLYLIELFKEQNQQDEFENYAKALNQTFNVMMPMWEERVVEIMVLQSLEEFPHIMEKLYASWPSDLARNYLRGLLTDNRSGERSGFGKAVLDEILMLIALIDTRKEIH